MLCSNQLSYVATRDVSGLWTGRVQYRLSALTSSGLRGYCGLIDYLLISTVLCRPPGAEWGILRPGGAFLGGYAMFKADAPPYHPPKRQAMDTAEIKYRFFLDNEPPLEFRLAINLEQSTVLVLNAVEPAADWTRLDFHQCSHCPLSLETHSHCPVALNIAEAVEQFKKIISYEEIDIEVITSERTIRQRTTAQQALSSLLGFMMATSDCPHTLFFRSMAQHHLPLADSEETACRAIGTYLLVQYFQQMEGKPANFNLDGLTEIYKNMHIINSAFAKRMRAACEADSSVNAIVLLDMFAQVLPHIIEDSLEEIRHLYEPYMEYMNKQG